MSPLVTILLYVVIPVGVIALVSAVMLRPSARQGGNRWRSGGAWDHEPMWWMANPRGSDVPAPPDPATVDEGRRTARGGARGTW